MEMAAIEDEVEEWWARWPDANVGIVTGRVSGIVVLDVTRAAAAASRSPTWKSVGAHCLPRLRPELAGVGAICGFLR